MEISEEQEKFYNDVLKEADEEWEKFSEEEKKRYNLAAKKSEQTGQDYYLFKKIAKKIEEEKLKCTASKKQ